MSREVTQDSRELTAAMRVAIAVTSGLSAFLGVLALTGWAVGAPHLATFGSGLIPMAPSTALLFVLYGSALSLRPWASGNRRVFLLGLALAALAAAIALLLLVLSLLKIHWSAEYLGMNIGGAVDGAPVGHMSPVTAICFLLSGASILPAQQHIKATGWRVRTSRGAIFFLLGLCLVFGLAYLYGAPLLYGGTMIPPALSTILAFTVLGLGLAMAALSQSKMWDQRREGQHSGVLSLPVIFILLTAGIVTAGYLYFQSYEKQHRAQVEQQLSAVSTLKANELVRWRAQRMGDARTLFNNPSFTALVRSFLERPADPKVRQRLQSWLDKFPQHYRYQKLLLVDAKGDLRMTAPASRGGIDRIVVQLAASTLRSNQVTFVDFHRHSPAGRIHLAVCIPIVGKVPGRRPLAAVIMRIDPTTFLYPFINTWPTVNQTAETLIIRRDGGDALFLNELRFRKNTALNLRISLKKNNVPAVKAALGRTGIVRGVDYRNVPVVAHVRAVTGSGWFLVARIDAVEVDAPLRARLWQVTILILAMLLCAAVIIWFLWRQQRIRFLERQSKTESEARHVHTLLAALVDATTDVVFAKDLQGRYLLFNRAAESVTGKKSADVIGMDAAFLFPPPEAEKVMAFDQRVLDSGEVLTNEDHVTTGDGRRRTFLSSRGPLLDPQGQVTGLFGISRDISDRKKDEDALRSSEAKLRRLLESNAVGVMLTDADGRITYANDAMLDLVGYDRADFDEGRVRWDAMTPPEYASLDRQSLVELSQHESIEPYEKEITRKDDARVPVLVAAAVLEASRSEYVYFVVDLTAQTELEREKQALEAQLIHKQKLESIGTLAGGVAHEINNPINGVINYAQLILDQSDEQSVASKYAKEIITETERVAMIVRNLLLFARQDHHSHSPARIEDIVESTLSLVRTIFKQDQIALEMEIPEGLPKLKCRSHQIQQVLMNLLTNARDALNQRFAGHHEDKRVRIRVTSLDRESGRWIRIAIQDQGAGIDPEVQRRIFEPFFTTKGRDQGTGLGLSISHSIVTGHHGELEFESRLGHGTTFHFDLPVDNGGG
jgi:PAS domain S-box-containing protein